MKNISAIVISLVVLASSVSVVAGPNLNERYSPINHGGPEKVVDLGYKSDDEKECRILRNDRIPKQKICKSEV